MMIGFSMTTTTKRDAVFESGIGLHIINVMDIGSRLLAYCAGVVISLKNFISKPRRKLFVISSLMSQSPRCIVAIPRTKFIYSASSSSDSDLATINTLEGNWTATIKPAIDTLTIGVSATATIRAKMGFVFSALWDTINLSTPLASFNNLIFSTHGASVKGAPRTEVGIVVQAIRSARGA
jgi:hypothetical protein